MCDLRLLREKGLTQLDKPEGTESVDDVIDFTCRCDVTLQPHEAWLGAGST